MDARTTEARPGLLPPPPEGAAGDLLRRESAAEAEATRAAYLARLAERVERRDGRTRTWCRELHAAAEEAHGVPARACADIAAAEERQPLVSGTYTDDDDDDDDEGGDEQTRLVVGTSDDEDDVESEGLAEMETGGVDSGPWWQWWCCGCTTQ